MYGLLPTCYTIKKKILHLNNFDFILKKTTVSLFINQLP